MGSSSKYVNYPSFSTKILALCLALFSAIALGRTVADIDFSLGEDVDLACRQKAATGRVSPSNATD